MLTPLEVSERAFQKVSFGGYNMAQVDEFLDLLTADYTSLYNENAVLKNKMKVLVEKVEEYRATEDTMRQALMYAQRKADELVEDAEQKRAAILRQAEQDAADRAVSVEKELQAEQFRLSSAQSATAAYVARVRALHEQELKYLDQLHELAPDAAPAADHVEQAASQIDDSVRRLVAQAMAEATAENLKAKQTAQPPEDLSDTAEFSPAQEEPAAPPPEEGSDPRRISFDNLQFGRDYEIK
ncbi:MAG: DivIVA domain-containing protein [Lawsonibacter sp.]|nr:DivIVA domain-containing protein [Lawsonibacter sp.]